MKEVKEGIIVKQVIDYCETGRRGDVCEREDYCERGDYCETGERGLKR